MSSEEKLRRDYYQCNECGYIRDREEEVGCWRCPKGEMIYMRPQPVFDDKTWRRMILAAVPSVSCEKLEALVKAWREALMKTSRWDYDERCGIGYDYLLNLEALIEESRRGA